jgi:23S rRNA pseudouridine2605 synthase
VRLNQFIAHATGSSRRQADGLIAAGRVRVDGAVAGLGVTVGVGDRVELDGRLLQLPTYRTIMLHKPAGYVTSRQQQGKTPTIYALLPPELHELKPVVRLDRESSGLLLLTNDGRLAQQLQHPSFGKWKRYEVDLNRSLSRGDQIALEQGVELEDGSSRLQVASLSPDRRTVVVRLQEGRNRQIRRTLGALGYRVVRLHRSDFGRLALGELPAGQWRQLGAVELVGEGS